MKNNEDIVVQLESEIKQIEYKIKNRRKYNNTKRFKYILIKGLLVLEMVFPFIIGTISTSLFFSMLGRTPIKKNKIVDKPGIQYEIDSNGNEKKIVSYNKEYDSNLIEYSTGWFLNENGMYERNVTTYRFDINEIREKYNTILSLSKKELDELFEITNIKKIQKNKLNDEDIKYENEYIIVKQVIDEEKYYRVRNETDFENFLETIAFFLFAFVEGLILENLSGVIFKKSLSTRLGYIELKNRPISEKEIESLKNILNLKKENLTLLK